jgi:hypothetical protein
MTAETILGPLYVDGRACFSGYGTRSHTEWYLHTYVLYVHTVSRTVVPTYILLFEILQDGGIRVGIRGHLKRTEPPREKSTAVHHIKKNIGGWWTMDARNDL